jgi:hypothetical protein
MLLLFIDCVDVETPKSAAATSEADTPDAQAIWLSLAEFLTIHDAPGSWLVKSGVLLDSTLFNNSWSFLELVFFCDNSVCSNVRSSLNLTSSLEFSFSL